MSINFKDQFIEIAISKQYKIKQPSFVQKKNNIDLILEGQQSGKPVFVSVDIKKKNRKDSNNWVYIEFQNSKGKEGWLYGDADFIVFETKQSFIFVPRKSLINHLSANQIVRWDLPFVDKPWNCKNRLFRRPKTNEIITQINTRELLSVPNHKIWKKPKS